MAFHSLATNLVSDDTNMASDVFIRDRLAQSTERICDAVQADGLSIVLNEPTPRAGAARRGSS